MSIYDEALIVHKKLRGKIEVCAKGEINNLQDLARLYSPGVAQPCIEIHKDLEKAYEYTAKGSMVAIVTDGTAVLGLGDIGPTAAIPVMEGKAVLFKKFGGVDAFPICIDSKDPEDIIKTVKLISPMFGGINLEDISAPKCFYIEAKLKKALNIPVFHDDQHGTAIVTLAALLNALKLVNKKIDGIKIAVNGIGSAGMAIVKLLKQFGARNFTICDSKGFIFEGDVPDLEEFESLIKQRKADKAYFGGLAEAVKDADLFIGVSKGDVLTAEMVKSMNSEPLIFALANPTPEIMPELALSAGAKLVSTGRTDYPNQINNVLAFPGIFKGALSVRATCINEEMKMAAVYALSQLIEDKDISCTNIIPNVFDERVVPAVAKAVSEAAIKSGVAKGL